MAEKRRATTFRTSKGTIVNVQYPDIYISPAFLSTEDVTNPAEMREVLREERRPSNIITAHPTGRLLFYDDFEKSTLEAVYSLDGDGDYRIGLNHTFALQGKYGLMMTTDAVAGRVVNLDKWIGNVDRKLGIELWWAAYPTIEHLGYFEVNLAYYPDAAGNTYYYAARLVPVSWDPVLRVLGATWRDTVNAVNLVTQKFYCNYRSFHNVKLIVDFDSGFAVKLYSDSAEIDLSSRPVGVLPPPNEGNNIIRLNLRLATGSANRVDMLIDCISFTTHEEGL